MGGVGLCCDFLRDNLLQPADETGQALMHSVMNQLQLSATSRSVGKAGMASLRVQVSAPTAVA
jgi:hypothetical protein